MKTIEVVAAIIMNEKNEILIAKRIDTKFKDMWEFPGGKIESNETNEHALVREIQEELEVLIKVDKYVGKIEYQYDEFKLIMHSYISFIVQGQINLNVHQDIKWIKFDEINKINWVPADVLVIEKMLETLNK